ncbi:chemotaxis protein CheW [Anaerocolumna cellulosilytica]|uniref:Chemotaxis protein CheW n=1 Tax=Anaerocolumna cellulosilytica TaxID=433286 RepID=A0A6S6R930_9FIRM|nr:chemotaxis protein CheW [Anaerocolumna cellulosilytica]MBB5195156.1 purine-binding chemotaxis protein CheW [Anaerocolumna cellulosilytica]BCJ96627.1 chemotaxis protein CheW [Anaerocolumna cellulosilytica]
METQKNFTKEQTKQVIFTLGEEEFGLDIMLVNAIEKYTDLVHVPNAPTYIRGIMNLRGDVIPVYSLRKKFGLSEKSADDNTKLIITKSNDILMAYEVDAVKEIIEIPAESLSETPAIVKSVNTAYIQCVANVNGRMILLLNHNGILSSQEQENIEAIMQEQ